MMIVRPTKIFLLVVYVCNFVLAANALEQESNRSASLRGSINSLSPKSNECIIPGGVGWYFCSNNNCPDDYTCKQKINTWIGFDCYKKDCDQNHAFGRTFDFKNVGHPVPNLPFAPWWFVNDPDICWEGTCTTDDQCRAGSKCFAKNNACACRSTLYSSDCKTIPEGGDRRDNLCNQSLPFQKKIPIHFRQAPSESSRTTPLLNPTKTNVENNSTRTRSLPEPASIQEVSLTKSSNLSTGASTKDIIDTSSTSVPTPTPYLTTKSKKKKKIGKKSSGS